MIKKIKKIILIIIITILIIGLGTAFIDYTRMNNNKLPIFSISNYDSSKKKQYFQGMFYNASRKVRASSSESINESSKIKFKLLFYFDLYVDNRLDIPKTEEYSFVLKKNEELKSNLYFANLDIKVYTYDIESVLVNNKELSTYFEKDKNIMDNIENSLGYTGLYNNTNTMMFKGENVRLYKCSNKDIYITSLDDSYQDDFCTNKDDDYKFIFEIKDESNDKELKEEEEVFYEDDNYKYTFDKVKSEYIFITTPEVRGKEETKRSLKEVLNNKLLSIDDLEKKGLSFTKIDKNKE